MATLITTAQYKEGVLIPQKKPVYPVEEVIVVYVPKTETNKEFAKRKIQAMEYEDERIWKMIEPEYRKIRSKLSRQKFPELYD